MPRRPRWSQLRILCLAVFASVFVAVLALQPTQALAVLILEGTFDVYYYDDTLSPVDDTTIDWMGTFTSDSSGAVTSFTSSIGECDSKCLFNKNPTLIFDGYELTGSVETAGGPGSLSLSLTLGGDWGTDNKFDSTIMRTGSFYVGLFELPEPAEVPEPGSLSLFIAGLGFLVWFSWHSRAKPPRVRISKSPY